MLHLVKFKGCQRCGGDLFLEHDGEEVYVSCLQCGAVYRQQAPVEKEPKKTRVPRVVTVTR